MVRAPATALPARCRRPSHGRGATLYRGVVVAIVLLVLVPFPGGPRAAESAAFNPGMIAAVVGSGMNFMMPRTLEPLTARQMALWGLNGLTAIDQALSITSDGATLRLVTAHGELAAVAAPAPDDVAGWSRAVAALMQAGWAQSQELRDNGQQALIQSFYDELFNHLDPYSRYVAPQPADTERDARTGGLAGPGFTIAAQARGALLVDQINANGPAWTAGVSVGWALIAVDGRSTRGQDADTVMGWMRGAPGSSVRLSFRPPRGAASTLTIQRAQVPPETVFAYSNDNVLILRVAAFSADTAQEMSEFLDEASQGGASQDDASRGGSSGRAGAPLRGVIIDLRGNRGGLLQQAVTTVALMLDHGVAVVTQGRDPQANHVWSVQGGDLTGGVPIVIMVDGRTASAAEITAAALADQRRAVVVGSATLGKGLVQTIGQMPDGGELFVTWSRMLAPQGWPLQGLGVMPQVCTSLGQAQIDTQMSGLAAGTDTLHDALLRWRRARAPMPASRVLELRGACPAAIGGDADLDVARTLIDNPAAYRAALIPVQEAAAAATAP